MKAKRPQAERALRAPGETRFFLLYGPDEAGSRALAGLLAEAMGKDAERIDLTGAELKSDPARLADEAAAISLFGGARYILVDPAGDECVPAVEALREAPAAGNPVALIAGALKASSRLLKLAADAPEAIAVASYAPEGREAERVVIDMARSEGLIVRPDVARRIADGAAGNRALIGQELVKFSIFLGAGPDASSPLDHDTIDLLGAAAEEGDLGRLVESVGAGDGATLEAEILRLRGEGIEGIPLLRAVLRRMFLLSRLRAEVEAGSSPGAVMASAGKAVFWKEQDSVGRQLARWRAPLIARTVSRLLEAERRVKASAGAGPVAAEVELFAICRQAARLR